MRLLRPGSPWLAAAAVLLLAAGWFLPPRLLSDGVGRYTAPVEREVAGEALELARITCLEHPASRLLVRQVRVSEVREVPGSCTMGPDPGGPTAEFVATVRAHGPFGVPLRSMLATCGGNAVVC